MRLAPHAPLASPALACALACAVAFAACAGASSVARADEAEDLFDRGRKLLEKKETVEEACRIFAQSLRLAERGDTLMNLAECHRRQGKTATAWAEFERALEIGDKLAYTEAILVARNVRDYLAARLSKLDVTVSAETAALPELNVVVNGAPWPRERWNTEVPFVANAKGYKTFSAHVVLGPEKDQRVVPVVLELEPPPPPPEPKPPPVIVPPRPPIPVWPWIVGGAGLVMGAVAIGFEADSLSAGKSVVALCGSSRMDCPTRSKLAIALSDHSRENTSYAAFVGFGIASLASLGAAGLGLGLWARGNQARVTLSPTSIAFSSSF